MVRVIAGDDALDDNVAVERAEVLVELDVLAGDQGLPGAASDLIVLFGGVIRERNAAIAAFKGQAGRDRCDGKKAHSRVVVVPGSSRMFMPGVELMILASVPGSVETRTCSSLADPAPP